MARVSLTDSSLIVSSPECHGRLVQAEPITVGVPWPRGLVRADARIGLRDGTGSDVPVQARTTERWPDGSASWTLLDFVATGPRVDRREYRIRVDHAAGPPQSPGLDIVETPGEVIVETGVARFEVRAGESCPFSRVSVGGVNAIDPSRTELRVTDADGRAWRPKITRLTVEERGDLRSTVRLEGFIGPQRRPLLHLTARVQFFAGSGATRVAVTLRNPRRASHPGGFWELGDPGSVYMQDVSFTLGLPSSVTAVECLPEPDAPVLNLSVPFELYQDSSGGAHWNSRTHLNRHKSVPCTFRGYRLRALDAARDGARATPAMRVTPASGCVSIAVEHFWQNFPKAIESDGSTMVLRLWPRQSADLHELQGGEQKTHRFTLAFGDDPVARDAVWWGRFPANAAAPPEWYGATGAVPLVSPAAQDPDPRYQQLVSLAIQGDDSFERKRETIDEYGWRHFGDVYADHENGFSGAAGPIVSHYNNQYDAIGGFACQFMRTGDARWWRAMNELAAHVADIDIYHTDRDKSAFNHGLFWHTFHYVDAGTSTHRSQPRDPRTNGGGPSAEHNYVGGLRLHWLLTGDPLSREAAIELASWVIDMDDGRKTILRWLTRRDTGLASSTRSPDFHGPGRGAGHSILALLEGHRLTREPRFLAKAEQLVHRCIHPGDDIDALTLLDAEQRWSYTAFLQALAKYLAYKVELEQHDESYAYGRSALLHYARWMADHEYPYLEKPEILEYPTETWAAQDMRKCEVFAFAAQHAAGAERERFVERARFFFDYSVSTLLAARTRSLARPLVLLLSNGPAYLASPGAPNQPAPADVAPNFGSPTIFRSQKTIAKQRLALASAAVLLIVVVLSTTIAWIAMR